MDLAEYEKLVVQHGAPGLLKHLRVSELIHGQYTWDFNAGTIEWADLGTFPMQVLGHINLDESTLAWIWGHPQFDASWAGARLVGRLRQMGLPPFAEPLVPRDVIPPLELAVVAGEVGEAGAVCVLHPQWGEPSLAVAVYDFPLEWEKVDARETFRLLESMHGRLPSLTDRTRLRSAFAFLGWNVMGGDVNLVARHPVEGGVRVTFDAQGEILEFTPEATPSQLVEEWVDEAIALFEAGSLDAAEALLMKVRDADARHYRMNLHLARIAEAREDWEAAYRWLRQTHRHAPDAAYPLDLMGQVLEQLQEPEKALEAYSKAVQLAPDEPQTLGRLGQLLAKTGQRGRALDVLHQAVRLNPDGDYNRYSLGTLLHEGGEFAAAILELEEAVRLDPCFLYLATLGDMLADASKRAREQARECYAQALALEPESTWAQNGLDGLQPDP